LFRLHAHGARIGIGARVTDPGPTNNLQRHDRLEVNAEALCRGDAVGVFGHDPEHALGARVAARHRRSVHGRTARPHQDAASRLERQVECSLQPIEPGLDVGVPGCGEIRPAHLIQPPHPRLGASVEHENVRVDFGNDAVGGGLVRDVGGDCGDAEPGADGPERIGAARDDRDFGTLVH